MRSLSLLSLSLAFVTGCLNVVDPATGEVAAPTYEEFLSGTYQEPDTGIFVVDGDIPIADEKLLREFYDGLVADLQAEVDGAPSTRKQGLALATSGGADLVWNATQKLNLTYCVSTSFGTRHAQMVTAMNDATAAWEAVASVSFIHVSAQDGSCSASNNNVLFDVRPVNAGGQYLARAFFPGSPRSGRNVLVDSSAFSLGSNPSLTGVLRHELGHVLGFRHEHTRPEAAACFEDNNWRPLTPYDSASVMHYPQCNGTSSSLALTARDGEGAASIYGAAGTPPPPPPSGVARSESFSGSVAKGASATLAPFAVVAGSTFTATMTGTGDPDLYVSFGTAPTQTAFACRPYLDGASESCSLSVPAGVTTAHVMVRGYTQATYTVNVSWLEPEGAPPPPPPPSGPTVRTDTFNGTVAANQNVVLPAFTVVPGTSFAVTMTGSGDPDLYVRFGSAPTTSTYACRPYLNGANESCSLTVPAGQTSAFVMVRGYAAFSQSSYNVSVTYTTP